MTTFERYLSEHKIDLIRLSIEAGVRYATVCDAVKEQPIFCENAQKIRAALYRLTRITYTGSLPTLDDPPPVNQFPTIVVQQIPKNGSH